MKPGIESRSKGLAIRRSPRLVGELGLRKSPRLPGKSGMTVLKRTAPRKPCKIPLMVYGDPNTNNDNGEKGESVYKVDKVFSGRRKRLLTSGIERARGMGPKAVSFTSIVGMCTELFAMICVDSRLLSDDYLTVLSNRYRKVIIVHNEVPLDSPKFRQVVAAFAGSNKVQQDLKVELPDQVKGNLYPKYVAMRIKEKLVQVGAKENAVIVMGLNEADLPEMYLVTLTRMKKINGFCCEGSGSEWTEPFLHRELKSSGRLPKGITPEKAKELGMGAIIDTAKQDVATGGFIQAIWLSKVGGIFKWNRSYKYQKDFDDCTMEYIDWPHKEDPKFDN